MRTMFVTAPFGRYDLGGFGPPAYGHSVPLVGGTRAYSHVRGDLMAPPDLAGSAPVPAGPWLGEGRVLGQDVVGGLTTLIEDALKELPPELLGTYQDKYRQCQDMIAKGGVVGLTTGGKCLDDLYMQIQKELKHPTPPAPKPAPYAAAPPSGFPVIPVVLVLVGGAAAVYGFTRLRQ